MLAIFVEWSSRKPYCPLQNKLFEVKYAYNCLQTSLSSTFDMASYKIKSILLRYKLHVSSPFDMASNQIKSILLWYELQISQFTNKNNAVYNMRLK